MIRLATLYSRTAGKFRELLIDESASTAIEYGMIAAGVGAAIAATVFSLGTAVKQQLYDKIAGIFN
jgi:Flp pilus assembly pilin Flp